MAIDPRELQRQDLCEWAQANGLDPNLIPQDSPFEIVHRDGRQMIRHEEYAVDENGAVLTEDDGLSARRLEKLSQLLVPLPVALGGRP